TSEVLNDREKYPDTAEVTLVDGRKISVKEFRDQLQPRSDYTRAVEAHKREKTQAEGAVTGLQQQRQELERQLAAALEDKKRVTPPAAPDGGPSEEELLADPVLGKIVRKL